MYHLWRNDPRRRLMDYLTSPVYTAGYVRGGDFEIDVLGRVRHPRGMPAVHHQLNRHSAAWREVLSHWKARLGDGYAPSDIVRERLVEEASLAGSQDGVASVGRAKPRQASIEQMLAAWPTERFRATNDSWCGDAPGFARRCAQASIPLQMWRIQPVPDKNFLC